MEIWPGPLASGCVRFGPRHTADADSAVTVAQMNLLFGASQRRNKLWKACKQGDVEAVRSAVKSNEDDLTAQDASSEDWHRVVRGANPVFSILVRTVEK